MSQGNVLFPSAKLLNSCFSDALKQVIGLEQSAALVEVNKDEILSKTKELLQLKHNSKKMLPLVMLGDCAEQLVSASCRIGELINFQLEHGQMHNFTSGFFLHRYYRAIVAHLYLDFPKPYLLALLHHAQCNFFLGNSITVYRVKTSRPIWLDGELIIKTLISEDGFLCFPLVERETMDFLLDVEIGEEERPTKPKNDALNQDIYKEKIETVMGEMFGARPKTRMMTEGDSEWTRGTTPNLNTPWDKQSISVALKEERRQKGNITVVFKRTNHAHNNWLVRVRPAEKPVNLNRKSVEDILRQLEDLAERKQTKIGQINSFKKFLDLPKGRENDLGAADFEMIKSLYCYGLVPKDKMYVPGSQNEFQTVEEIMVKTGKYRVEYETKEHTMTGCEIRRQFFYKTEECKLPIFKLMEAARLNGAIAVVIDEPDCETFFPLTLNHTPLQLSFIFYNFENHADRQKNGVHSSISLVNENENHLYNDKIKRVIQDLLEELDLQQYVQFSRSCTKYFLYTDSEDNQEFFKTTEKAYEFCVNLAQNLWTQGISYKQNYKVIYEDHSKYVETQMVNENKTFVPTRSKKDGLLKTVELNVKSMTDGVKIAKSDAMKKRMVEYSEVAKAKAEEEEKEIIEIMNKEPERKVENKPLQIIQSPVEIRTPSPFQEEIEQPPKKKETSSAGTNTKSKDEVDYSDMPKLEEINEYEFPFRRTPHRPGFVIPRIDTGYQNFYQDLSRSTFSPINYPPRPKSSTSFKSRPDSAYSDIEPEIVAELRGEIESLKLQLNQMNERENQRWDRQQNFNSYLHGEVNELRIALQRQSQAVNTLAAMSSAKGFGIL